MGPSERIRYIRKITSVLDTEEWSLVDLTLRQFNLPWSDNWQGSQKSAYIIEMIDNADDGTLIELAKHLGIEDVISRLHQRDISFWEPNQFRIFLCHVSSHKELVTAIQETLKRQHISSFVAHVDIEPTREWVSEIEVALETTDALVAILTPKFHESYWTDQEIGAALIRGIPIVPIRLGLDPYGFIGRFQAINGANKSPKELANEIVDVLLANKLSKDRMHDSVIARFEQAISFQDAKEAICRIETLDKISQTELDRLHVTLKANRQTRESFGVPDRVKAIARKYNLEYVDNHSNELSF